MILKVYAYEKKLCVGSCLCCDLCVKTWICECNIICTYFSICFSLTFEQLNITKSNENLQAVGNAFRDYWCTKRRSLFFKTHFKSTVIYWKLDTWTVFRRRQVGLTKSSEAYVMNSSCDLNNLIGALHKFEFELYRWSILFLIMARWDILVNQFYCRYKVHM